MGRRASAGLRRPFRPGISCGRPAGHRACPRLDAPSRAASDSTGKSDRQRTFRRDAPAGLLDQRRRVRSARLAAPVRTRGPARSRRPGTPMAARRASPSVDRGRRAAAPHGQATRAALEPSRSTTSLRPAPCRRSHRTAAANLHGAPAMCPPNVRVTGPTSTAPAVVVRPGARPTTAGPDRSVAASMVRASHRWRRRPCRTVTSHQSSKPVLSCMWPVQAFSMPD